MWETHTISGVNLEFGEDNIDYNCIIEFNYLPEEVEVIYIKLEVADNIYTTLDSEYITGDVLEQASNAAISYMRNLERTFN